MSEVGQTACAESVGGTESASEGMRTVLSRSRLWWMSAGQDALSLLVLLLLLRRGASGMRAAS